MSNEEILKQQIESLNKLLEIKNQIISELEKKNYYRSYYHQYPYYPQGTWITTAQSTPNNITFTGTSGTIPVSTTSYVQPVQNFQTNANLSFLDESKRNKQ